MFIATLRFLLVGLPSPCKTKAKLFGTVLKVIIYLSNIDIKPYLKFSTTKCTLFKEP